MVVLKKISSASLVETITATTLLILVYVIAGMIVHSILSSTLKNDTSAIDTHLEKLVYQYQVEQPLNPPETNFNDWTISIEKKHEHLIHWIEIRAAHQQTKKVVTKRILDETP